MTVAVFIAPVISEVLRLYDGLVDEGAWQRTVGAQLELLGARLLEGQRAGMPGAVFELQNWHPAFVNQPTPHVLDASLSMEDALTTMARAHGFESWPSAASACDREADARFEAAIELVLAGDLVTLTKRIKETPRLVSSRSHYGHRATLLHYVAANGVETYRQRVPSNAAEVAALLVHRGADVRAVAGMYGGNQTTRDLLVTSSHPLEAGVARAIEEALCAAPGAA